MRPCALELSTIGCPMKIVGNAMGVQRALHAMSELIRQRPS